MNVSEAVGRFMAAVVLVAAVLAFLVPATGLWISAGWIDWLLMAIMFGMGLTIRPADFKAVFVRPKDVAVGCAAQFLIMPALAFGLGKAFGLNAELLTGVVLVGACPGGTASNVITYLAKGDTALSVGMTATSTLLAPLLTPLLVLLLVGETVDVNVLGMLLSILWVVILPIVLGLLVKRLLPKATEQATAYLPAVSSIAICLIVMIVIAANAHKLLAGGWIVILVVMLHNILGLTVGYLIGLLLKMTPAKRRAISVEVGMQNSGLASSLATLHFAAFPLATVPGAIFSVWHNISGAIVARLFARQKLC